jgi:hypothetical protein
MTWQLIDGVVANDAFATPASPRTFVLQDGLAHSQFDAGATASDQPVDGVLGLTTWAAAGGPSSVVCDLSATDSSDTLAAGIVVQVGAALSTSDSADSLASGAGVVVLATAVTTDTSDALSSGATVVPLVGGVVCTLESTDEADALAASATVSEAQAEDPVSLGGRNKLFDVPARRVLAALSVQDADDTLQAACAVQRLTEFALWVTDDDDLISATASSYWKEAKLVIDRAMLVRAVKAPLIRTRYAEAVQ